MTAYEKDAPCYEAYEEGAALLAELLFEKGCAALNDNSKLKNQRLSIEDERALAETIDHLRAAIIMQAENLRRWRRRQETIINPLQRQFSALEGLLVRHHLRLHWLLYRRAMRMGGAQAGRLRARLWAV